MVYVSDAVAYILSVSSSCGNDGEEDAIVLPEPESETESVGGGLKRKRLLSNDRDGASNAMAKKHFWHRLQMNQ